MFQGLSLEQAPPYKVPLYFYLTAAFFLIAFGVLYSFFGLKSESRFAYEAIALTHTFTIGFVTFVMVGSLFQMLPVMLGLPYKQVVKNAKIVYFLLLFGVIGFDIGFFLQNSFYFVVGGSLLFSGLLYFSFISLQTVFKSVERDFLVNTFSSAFFFLALGAIFGFLSILGHVGIVDSVLYGKIHMGFILFGWVFLLLSAVSYKIIPMFFVAKEFPSWIKEYFFIFIGVLLVGYFLLVINQNYFYKYMLLGIICLIVIFAFFSIKRLWQRKRSRKDLSVMLWYFSMANIFISAVMACITFFTQYDVDILIGYVVLFGVIFSLINAMLYKIIPFLTWFHLSSAMVFDAEMQAVIPKKQMQYQIWSYFFAYGSMIIGFKYLFFFYISALFWSINGIFLLKNIKKSITYYDVYIKKAVSFTME